MATAYEDILCCPVCYQEFEGRDPRSLPCLHSFCLECLSGVYDTAKTRNANTSSIRCPLCQAVTVVPTQNIHGFPKYFQANQIKDIIKDQKKSKTLVCSICIERAAIYCFDCKKTFCSGCRSRHDTSSRYKSHALASITPQAVAQLICAEHHNWVEVYCEDCERAICQECESKAGHIQHCVVDLPNSLTGIRRRSNKRAEKTFRTPFQNTRFDSHVAYNRASLRRQKNDSSSLVNCVSLTLWENPDIEFKTFIPPFGIVIRRESGYCLQDVKAKRMPMEFMSVSSRVGVSDFYLNSLTSTLVGLEGRISGVMEISLFCVVAEQWDIKAQFKVSEPCCAVAVTADDFVIVGGCRLQSCLSLYTSQGEMKWTTDVSHLIYDVVVDMSNRFLVSGEGNISIYNKNGQCVESFPQLKYRHILSNPAGMCLDSNGNILVADMDKKKVLMFTAKGTYLQEILSLDKVPWNIALLSDRYLAVGFEGGMGAAMFELQPQKKARYSFL